MSTKSGIEEAVKAAGGQVQMAEALGVTQQAVSIWVRQGWAPNGRIVEIETRFGVPRQRLINPRIADLVDLPVESEGGEA